MQIGKLRLGARKGLSRGERWSGRAAGCRKITNPPPGVLLIPGGDCKASFLLKERTSLPAYVSGSAWSLRRVLTQNVYVLGGRTCVLFSQLFLIIYTSAATFVFTGL